MTETPSSTAPVDPPPPPPPPPRRLTRTGSDRILTGVAGGLGRHFELDPLLFRLGFVVLTLFGGGGLILYLVLAVLVPSDGAPGTGDRRAAQAVIVVLAVAAALSLGGGAATAVAFGGGTIVAAIVLALGLALIVASFAGGGRWLIAPALLLAIPVALVAAADISLEGGVGEREYRPASVSDLRDEYRLGVGELVLDLRDVDFGAGTTTVRTHVGIGETRVLLPSDVLLSSDIDLGLGETEVLDRENHGVDVSGTFVERAGPAQPVLRLSAEGGIGEVVVSRP